MPEQRQAATTTPLATSIAPLLACPKPDEGQRIFLEKIKAFIDDAKVNTLNVIIMQAPCYSGLLRLVQKAAGEASRKIPTKAVVIGIEPEVLSEERV